MKNRIKVAIIFSTVIISILFFVKPWEGRSVEDKVEITFDNGLQILVDIADTKPSRKRGLMYREKMESNEGMLFVFENEDYYSFWMRNMKFPVDMIWIDIDNKVVHIEEDVPVCVGEVCEFYAPLTPAKYMLEVNAGIAYHGRIKVGDRIRVSS